jgi:hypothetical protein
MDLEYDNFDWETYININLDLNYITNKDDAWQHWKNHGFLEERPISLINNSNIHNGRFGNLFFVNMALHFIALKNNLRCRYKYFTRFKQLGIHLFIGNKVYDTELVLQDDTFINLIKNNNEKCNIIINNSNWFQTTFFCIFLKIYFNIDCNKFNIINNNIFKKRYRNNNDLFIHIRLGDVTENIGNIHKYYEKTLSELDYVTGYISSDCIDHEFCKHFINKYNLIIVNTCEVKTIMFGSTCNNIILSGGTFSWLIGFFAFFSKNIYYPNIKDPWYGDIFGFPNWKCVNY